jgi:hypothetical protein
MPLDDTNWPQTTGTEVTDEATALLIRARALVARGWCRKAAARSRFGFRVSPYSRSAIAWCAAGAVQAAAFVTSDLDRRSAHYRLIAAIDGEILSRFNDSQETVEPVLAAFDRAIAAGKSAR